MNPNCPPLAALAVLLLASSASSQCEDQTLLASDLSAQDAFGRSVSVSGTIAVVGAPFVETIGPEAGAVYVFELGGSGWTQTARLTANDAVGGERFGTDVDVQGERIVVGAPRDGNGGVDAGAVYVLDRQGGSWIQTAKLLASDAMVGDLFGTAVELEGDTVVIGSPFHDAPGVSDAGAAYVFDLAGTWSETQTIQLGSPGVEDEFGTALALEGDRLLVGAPRRSALAGEVIVYQRVSGVFGATASLTSNAPLTQPLFGASIDLDGDRCVIGAPQETQFAPFSGRAYIFAFSGANWNLQKKVVSNDVGLGDLFGSSVAIDGDVVAIGAKNDNTAGPNSGTVFLFRDGDSGWIQDAKIIAEDSAPDDEFGTDVALDQSRLFVGAWHHDAAPTLMDSGATYIFRIPGVEPLFGCPAEISLATGGVHTMDLNAGPAFANQFYLVLGSGSGTLPILVVDGVPIPLTFPDAYFNLTLISPTAALSNSFNIFGTEGTSQTTFTVPGGTNPNLAGLTLNHAFVTLQIPPTIVTSASNPVSVKLVP